MEKTADQLLAEMMQRALDGTDAALDFSYSHLPDLVEQLLAWRALESGLDFIIGASLILGSVFLGRKILRDRDSRAEWTNFGHSPDISSVRFDFSIAAAPCLGVAGFLLALCSLDWLMILVAPKLYLFEYAASLVK